MSVFTIILHHEVEEGSVLKARIKLETKTVLLKIWRGGGKGQKSGFCCNSKRPLTHITSDELFKSSSKDASE